MSESSHHWARTGKILTGTVGSGRVMRVAKGTEWERGGNGRAGAGGWGSGAGRYAHSNKDDRDLLSTHSRPEMDRSSRSLPVPPPSPPPPSARPPPPRRRAETLRPTAGKAAEKAVIQLSTSATEMSSSRARVSRPLPTVVCVCVCVCVCVHARACTCVHARATQPTEMHNDCREGFRWEVEVEVTRGPHARQEVPKASPYPWQVRWA